MFSSSTFYVKIMQKISTEGNGYIDRELQRTKQLIASGAIDDEKLDDFRIRRNILLKFAQVGQVRLKSQDQEL